MAALFALFFGGAAGVLAFFNVACSCPAKSFFEVDSLFCTEPLFVFVPTILVFLVPGEAVSEADTYEDRDGDGDDCWGFAPLAARAPPPAVEVEDLCDGPLTFVFVVPAPLFDDTDGDLFLFLLGVVWGPAFFTEGRFR